MKDAYYFSHDANAMDDPKIMLLVSQLGIEGYGIYWVIIEHLRNQPNFITSLNVVPGLAMRCGTTREKIQTVIKQFDLFVIENNTFYSPSLITRMEPYLARKEAGRIGGIASGIARNKQLNKGSTMVERSLNKESKVKESKVNKIKEEYTFGEFVKMSIEEHKKLIDTYGDKKTNDMLQTLDNYKGSSGKKYKSDYRAILSWVVDKTQSPKKSIFPEKETPQEYTNRMRQEGYKYEKIETNTGYTYQWIK